MLSLRVRVRVRAVLDTAVVTLVDNSVPIQHFVVTVTNGCPEQERSTVVLNKCNFCHGTKNVIIHRSAVAADATTAIIINIIIFHGDLLFGWTTLNCRCMYVKNEYSGYHFMDCIHNNTTHTRCF
jgi:hypothetical protein